MRAEFFKCHACDDIFSNADDYGSCVGCHRNWCEDCNGRVNTFLFDGRDYCDLCFEHKTDAQLLEAALKRLNMNRQDLESEVDTREWACTSCGNTFCAELDTVYEDESLIGLAVSRKKGTCCKCIGSQFSHCFECK